MAMNSKNDSHDESKKLTQDIEVSNVLSSSVGTRIFSRVHDLQIPEIPETQDAVVQGCEVQIPVTHVSNGTVVTDGIIKIFVPENVLDFLDMPKHVKKCFEHFLKEISSYDISSAGNKILVTYNGKVSEYDIDDGRVIPLADFFRWYISDIEKIGWVKVNHRKIQYIAVAFDEHLGVIVDIINKKVMGFVDASDIRYVNAFTTSLHTQGSDSYRFLESVTINDTSIALQLSHVIFCAHNNFFPSNTFNIHHVHNSCDNRFQFLETREPNSYHPPMEVSSDAYICKVIESLGYTVDDFTSICVNKALEMKNSK